MKEGRKRKDAIILDGFNFEKLGALKKGELKKAKKQAVKAKEDPAGPQQQTVFVVLKGLEETPMKTTNDSAIDLKQVSAALTPEGKEYDS